MTRASLGFEGVTFAYDQQPVVKNITLNIEPGELVVVVGPSGCGKSTLLRLVAGLLMPQEGRVLIDGRDVQHVPPHMRRVGWVPQSYALFDHLNVADNILFGLRMQAVPQSERATRLREMLELCRITELAQRSVSALSGGQRQRVAIARALAVNPQLLLLDEPLAALDPQLRQAIRSDLEALLRSSGVTTLFVTHDQAEALALADRVAVLRAGQLEQFDTPEQLWNAPANSFVAEFVGGAVVVQARRLDTQWVEIAPGLTALSPGDAAQIALALRPSDLEVAAHGAPLPVMSCEYLGGVYIITCCLPDGKALRLHHHARAVVGERLPVALKPGQRVVTLPS
jgi:ABC-type Fe3+/spermidine/putrescine transport system ATPase subunit